MNDDLQSELGELAREYAPNIRVELDESVEGAYIERDGRICLSPSYPDTASESVQTPGERELLFKQCVVQLAAFHKLSLTYALTEYVEHCVDRYDYTYPTYDIETEDDPNALVEPNLSDDDSVDIPFFARLSYQVVVHAHTMDERLDIEGFSRAQVAALMATTQAVHESIATFDDRMDRLLNGMHQVSSYGRAKGSTDVPEPEQTALAFMRDRFLAARDVEAVTDLVPIMDDVMDVLVEYDDDGVVSVQSQSEPVSLASWFGVDAEAFDAACSEPLSES